MTRTPYCTRNERTARSGSSTSTSTSARPPPGPARPRDAGAEEADAEDEEASGEAGPAHEGTVATARTGAVTIGRPATTDRREEPDPEGEGVADAARRPPTSTTRCRSHRWDRAAAPRAGGAPTSPRIARRCRGSRKTRGQ